MDEDILYESNPSKKLVLGYIVLDFLRILLFSFFVAYALSASHDLLDVFLKNFIPFALTILFVRSIYDYFLIRTYRYRITKKGVSFAGGLLIKRQTFVPITKITDVNITQNALDQILLIKKIEFQTAGTGGKGKTEIIFEGIINEEKPKQLIYELLEKQRIKI